MGEPADVAQRHDGAADSVFGVDQTMVADYTESVVPLEARRSNFRMMLTFGSMQLVFGAVLVGYSARFEGFSLGSLIAAMAIAAVTMTVYCIGSAISVPSSARRTRSRRGECSAPLAARLCRCCWSLTEWASTCSPCCS